jgi:hypothetical protein
MGRLAFGIVVTCLGCGVAVAAPAAKTEKPTVVVDGLIGGEAVRPQGASAEAGVEAALKLLAGSKLTDFLQPGERIGEDFWDAWVTAGLDRKRPHVRMKFSKPRQVQVRLNGKEATITLSEVVFFDPTDAKGAVALMARDGTNYYFANALDQWDDFAKWVKGIKGK